MSFNVKAKGPESDGRSGVYCQPESRVHPGLGYELVLKGVASKRRKLV